MPFVRNTVDATHPRHGLHHPEGNVGGAAARDPRGARPEVGGGQETTAGSSPASRLTLMASCNRVAGDAGRDLDAVGLPVAGNDGLVERDLGRARRQEEAYLDILPIWKYMSSS